MGMFSGGEHYEAEVNRGSLSVKGFTGLLNKRWRDGWSLAHLIEQDGNTVMVWERRPAEAASTAHLPPPPV